MSPSRQTAVRAGTAVLLTLLLLIGLQISPLLNTTTQETVSITAYLGNPGGRLPPMKPAPAVAPAIADIHLVQGGSTYSLRWGDLNGRPLYVVSVYPDRSLLQPGAQIDPDTMVRFIRDNAPLLSDPRNTVGTWYNTADGNTYIDISTVMADQGEALALGRRYNQIAIWDLDDAEEIDTGGDGAPLDDLPPIEQRLPPLTESQSP